MSGVFGLSGFPVCRRHLAYPANRPFAELRQYVEEVFSEIDVQAPTGFHDGRYRGDLRPGLWAADVQPVLASQCQRTNGSFAPIIIDLQRSVLQILFPPAPLSDRIVASLGQLAAGLDLLADFNQ